MEHIVRKEAGLGFSLVYYPERDCYNIFCECCNLSIQIPNRWSALQLAAAIIGHNNKIALENNAKLKPRS